MTNSVTIHIELTREPIPPDGLLQQVMTKDSGAVVLFLGNVREMTEGRRTLCLEYEGHEELARAEFQRLADLACQNHDVNQILIMHRLGRVELAETSVAICVASAHRRAAFEACSWLMDRTKETVPIWKKELWADGTSEWVHPTQQHQQQQESQREVRP